MFTFLYRNGRTATITFPGSLVPNGGGNVKKRLFGPFGTTVTERPFGAHRRVGNLFPVGITDEKQFRCNGFRRNYNPAVMEGNSSGR